MGDEAETHTSGKNNYELQQSIFSSSDCEEVTLKCYKQKKLFSTNKIRQIFDLCEAHLYMGKWLRNTGCEKPCTAPSGLINSLTRKSAHGLLTSVPKLPNVNVRY